jgi:hypothetical protein
MGDTLSRLVALASKFSGIPVQSLSANSAVAQDIRIYGMDVWEFEEALTSEFGIAAHDWPWHRFAELSEGLGGCFPFTLLWQLLSWPFRGSFGYPSEFERLELGHIAAVIEKGEWFEP